MKSSTQCPAAWFGHSTIDDDWIDRMVDRASGAEPPRVSEAPVVSETDRAYARQVARRLPGVVVRGGR
jgi:hypothetical protein